MCCHLRGLGLAYSLRASRRHARPYVPDLSEAQDHEHHDRVRVVVIEAIENAVLDQLIHEDTQHLRIRERVIGLLDDGSVAMRSLAFLKRS
jgi:hypothetical protein